MRKFLLTCFLLNSIVLVGQEAEENEFTRQLWVDLNPSWNISENEKIVADVGYRTIWPRNWQRFILRGNYTYNSYDLIFKSGNTKESLIGGLGFFYLSDFNSYNSLEIRPVQGYKLHIDLTDQLVVTQLLRVEERFYFHFDSYEPAQFGLRLRYQIKTEYLFKRLSFQQGTGLYMPFSVEFFFNAITINQFNDVIRLTPGIGYQFNSDFKIQFTAAYHYTRQEIGRLIRTNDIVFRFSFYKTIF